MDAFANISRQAKKNENFTLRVLYVGYFSNGEDIDKVEAKNRLATLFEIIEKSERLHFEVLEKYCESLWFNQERIILR